MRFNDAVLGAVLIGFAIVAFLEARTFPQVPGQNYGAALFPLIIAAALGFSGMLLVLSGARRWRVAPLADFGAAEGRAGRFFNVALVIATLVFYILTSEPLGFIPTAFIIVAVLLMRLRGRLLSSLAIAAATVFFVHLVFSRWLLVPLPWGVLEPLVY